MTVNVPLRPRASGEGSIRHRVFPYASLWIGLSLCLGSAALLWLLNVPYRNAYQPTDNDVTALTDGLLMLPGTSWQDWFIHGHSHFFDAYPDWPLGLTAFARPVFQSLIYLEHLVLGNHWAAYLVLNYLTVGGMAAVAFAIARTALRLGLGAALFAAALVVIAPAVLEFSIWQIGFASESLASILIGGTFLALIARRDSLAVALLLIAMFTKETALWAPFAAMLTVLLRADSEGRPLRRLVAAGGMLVPLAIWFGFRLAFYDGISGTYASPEYTPLNEFYDLVRDKLLHLHHLFVQQAPLVNAGPAAMADQTLRAATALLSFFLLLLWLAAASRAAWPHLAAAVSRKRWPALEPSMLATLWALAGLGFYCALPVPSTRYAAAAVMFAWPAIVHAIFSYRAKALQIALAACLAFSLGRTTYFFAEMNPPAPQSDIGQFFHAAEIMDTALRQLPPEIHEVYVLMAGGMVTANPADLRAFFGVKADIIRVIDMTWRCDQGEDAFAIAHNVKDGVVTISATLPECGRFAFLSSMVPDDAVVDGVLRRNDRITYELPDAQPIYHTTSLPTSVEPGRRVTVQIRPQGPARFIFTKRVADSSLAWFDTP